MLSVSTMALATMLGAGCPTNTANVNTYNPSQYNASGCPQNVQYQNGGQQLDSILSQIGVCVQGDASWCGLNPDCNGGNCLTNACRGNRMRY